MADTRQDGKGNWEQSVMGWFIYMINERPVSLILGYVALAIITMTAAFWWPR